VNLLGIQLRQRARTLARLHTVAVAAMVTMLALVAGLLNGARPYFHCSSMEMTTLEPCCAHEDGQHDRSAISSETTAIRNADSSCCERRSFGTAGGAVEPRALSFPSAPLVAILPAMALPRLAVVLGRTMRRASSTRAGPTAPVRAQLQVYLC
jgi:hypothetical protein